MLPFQKTLWLGWIVSLSMVFAVVFGNYPLQQIDDKSPAIIGGLYHSISRITWSMALAFIIYACHFGYGGPINWFLSLPGWQPFSRLTYAIYLLHMPMMLLVGGQSRTSHYFSELNAVSTLRLPKELILSPKSLFHISPLFLYRFIKHLETFV